MSKPQFGSLENMFEMETIAREVAGKIIDYKGKNVYDIKVKNGEYQGESVIDELACNFGTDAFLRLFGRPADMRRQNNVFQPLQR